MKTLLILLVPILVSNVVSAKSIKLSSRDYIENKNGEIIEVDASVTNSLGDRVAESAPALSRIRGSNEIYTSVQHILIPSTTEVRQGLLNSRGQVTIEGSILEEKVISSENVVFKQIKVFVREIE